MDKAVAETTSAVPVAYNLGTSYESGGYQAGAGMPANGGWSNNVPFSGTDTNLVKWEYNTESVFPKDVAIDKEGNSYFLRYQSPNSVLISLDKRGTERFRKVIADSGVFQNSAVIDKDGRIVLTGHNKLYFLDKDGNTLIESQPVPTPGFDNNPTIGNDGTLYVVSGGEKKIFAINVDGSLKWKSDYLSQVDTSTRSPVISKDGTIYQKTDSYLYALDQDGKLKWTLSTLNTHDIVLLKNGKIGMVRGDTLKPWIRIATAEGVLEKEFSLSGNGGSWIVQSEYNEQLLVGVGNNLHSYNEDGTLNWTYATGGTLPYKPIIDKNGIIYFQTNDGIVTALRPDGTEKWHINLKLYYNHAGNLSFGSKDTLSMTPNGTLYTMMRYYGSGVDEYKMVAIGDDKEPDDGGDICGGYLEQLEQKLASGTITEEEIKEAQMRLSKDLYDLSKAEE